MYVAAPADNVIGVITYNFPFGRYYKFLLKMLKFNRWEIFIAGTDNDKCEIRVNLLNFNEFFLVAR